MNSFFFPWLEPTNVLRAYLEWFAATARRAETWGRHLEHAGLLTTDLLTKGLFH